MEAAHYKLIINDIEGCKAAMDECEKILDDLPETEPVINASFYRVSANYYKVIQIINKLLINIFLKKKYNILINISISIFFFFFFFFFIIIT